MLDKLINTTIVHKMNRFLQSFTPVDIGNGPAATIEPISSTEITIGLFSPFDISSTSNEYNAKQTKIDIFCDTREEEIGNISINLTNVLICGLVKVIIDTIGLFGNCLTLIVLRKPNMKSSMTTILIGLTLFDSLLLFVDLSCFSFPTLLRPFTFFDMYTKVIAPFVAPYAYPLINVAIEYSLTGLTGSEYFTMFVTIERYLMVCWPFKVKDICTHRNILGTSIMLAIFSFALNIPRLFEHKSVQVIVSHYESTTVTINPNITDDDNFINGTNNNYNYYESTQVGTTYYYEVHLTKFGAHKLYKFIYLFLLWTILRFILPFLTLIILNIAIWRRISRANRFIRSRTSIEKLQKEFPITQMSFCIVAVFGFCTIPYLFNRILRGGLRVAPVPFMVYFSTLAISFNSAINWFIYCVFSKKYRYNLFRVINNISPCIYNKILKHFVSSSMSGNSYYFGRHYNNDRKSQVPSYPLHRTYTGRPVIFLPHQPIIHVVNKKRGPIPALATGKRPSCCGSSAINTKPFRNVKQIQTQAYFEMCRPILSTPASEPQSFPVNSSAYNFHKCSFASL